MLQVKILQENKVSDLNNSINDFLATIKTEDVKDIKFGLTAENFPLIAIIQYEVKETFADRKCYDCKYWDDGGDTSSTSGFCIECGGRRRFNCNACAAFKDVREG